MNIEEIIPILIAGLEQKYRNAKSRTNLISLLWCIVLVGGIVGILGFVFHEILALNLSLVEYLSEHKRLSTLFPLPFFIGGLFIVHLCRKSSIESHELGFSRNKELLMEPKNHRDYYQRGQFLLENKYYELAHDDFSKAIDELYRESEELSDKLSRFLSL